VDLETASAGYLEAFRRKSRLGGTLARLRRELEEFEIHFSNAEKDVERFDKARKAAGWRPPTPHQWVMRKTRRKGKEGFLVSCGRCGTKIFMPKIPDAKTEFSEFQRDIRIVMHFVDKTLKMPEAFYKSMSIPSDSEHFPDGDIGLHGRLSKECDLVIRLPELLKDFHLHGPKRPADEEFQ